MLQNLRLNFMGLTGSLLDLAPVNFLVGANGSGKTRVLRSLGMQIRDDYSGPPIPLPPMPFNADEGVYIEPNHQGYVSTLLVRDVGNGVSMPLELVSDALGRTGQSKLEKRVITAVRNSGLGQPVDSASEPTEVWLQGELQVANGQGRLDWWSGGTRLMAGLIQALNFEATPWPMAAPNLEAIIVGVEEPETGLHPKAHRELVELFLDASRTGVMINDPMNGQRRVPVQFFVTTHSSSLIAAAAAKESDTKIYVLDEIFKPNTNPIPFERGITGPTAISYANGTLGAELSDYLPNRVVIAEGSILELMRASGGSTRSYLELREKRGDSQTATTATQIAAFAEEAGRFYGGEPFRSMFRMEVIAIFDSVPSEVRKKIEALPSKGVTLVVLGEVELEELYSAAHIAAFLSGEDLPERLDNQPFTSYAKQIVTSHSEKWPNAGMLKCALATFVSAQPGFELPDKLKSIVSPGPTKETS
jgi:AAA domain, putative AbiEii toxin, Type IV TA system